MPSDLVTDFFHYTSDDWSPEIFRRWAGIAMVGMALERRVFITTGPFTTFPNLYTLLVAPPGTGKQVISTMRELLVAAKASDGKDRAFKVADKSVTKASLIDTLFESKVTRTGSDGTKFSYSALAVCAEEFSVLLPSYDMEFIGALNEIYNNDTEHSERRRHGRPPRIVVEYPMLNLLGGIQPALMSSAFPEEVWATGLGRRCIMVFNAEQKIRDPFAVGTSRGDLRESILARLTVLSGLSGEVIWDPEAAEAFTSWWLAGGAPRPTHGKLVAYNQNRAMNIMKLTTISAVSRGEMTASLLDLDRAKAWLLEAEGVMPDIFRAMLGKSDASIIEELHRYFLAFYLKHNSKPFDVDLIWNFIGERVPSEKTKFIMDLAINTGVIARVAGTMDKFVPKGVFTNRPE